MSKGITSVTPFSKVIALLSFLILLSGAFAVGLQYQFISDLYLSQKNEESIALSRKPTPTPEITKNWKIYKTRVYSIKYPFDWIIMSYGNSAANGVRIFNPKTMKDEESNGNSTGRQVPSQFIVISSMLSSQSAKSYVDRIESLYSDNENIVKYLDRTSLQINEASAEAYIEPGEASKGRIIILSNKTELTEINSSADNPKDKTKIENLIISTFNFNSTLP